MTFLQFYDILNDSVNHLFLEFSAVAEALFTKNSPHSWRKFMKQLFLAIYLVIFAMACGGGAGYKTTDTPSDETVTQIETPDHQTGMMFSPKTLGIFASGTTMDARIDGKLYPNMPTNIVLALSVGEHILNDLTVWPPFVLGQPRLVQVLKNGPIGFKIESGKVAVINPVIGPYDLNNDQINDCKNPNSTAPLCQNTGNGDGSVQVNIVSTDANGDGCVDTMSTCPTTSSTTTPPPTTTPTATPVTMVAGLQNKLKVWSQRFGDGTTTAVNDSVLGKYTAQVLGSDRAGDAQWTFQSNYVDGKVNVGQVCTFSFLAKAVDADGSVSLGVYDNTTYANLAKSNGADVYQTTPLPMGQVVTVIFQVTITEALGTGSNSLWSIQYGSYHGATSTRAKLLFSGMKLACQ